MKIIAFITEEKLIQHILQHLDLWRNKPSRDPPVKNKQIIELVYEPVFDDWPIYEEPCFQVNWRVGIVIYSGKRGESVSTYLIICHTYFFAFFLVIWNILFIFPTLFLYLFLLQIKTKLYSIIIIHEANLGRLTNPKKEILINH